jgi:hypothetical protein
MARLIICILLFFLPYVALGAGEGVGGFAGQLMEPTHILLQFVKIASFFIGLASLFAALIFYMQHRENPAAHPWSTIILLFIIGIVLICLPYVDKIMDNFPSFLR